MINTTPISGEQHQIKQLLDEVEQLRMTLEATSDEMVQLSEDRDRLLRRVTTQARDLHSANAAYSKASSDQQRQAAADVTTQFQSDQDREELRVAFEEMQVLTEELEVANNSLHETNKALDRRVQERTGELETKNAALGESELRFRTLVENMPQLVWRALERGEWTWANPQWTAYTGLSLSESRGWGWLDALPPDDREAVRETWRKTAPDQVIQLNCRIRHAGSGRYAWFQIRGVPVQEDDRFIEWIGSGTDVDDQMQAREVLRRTGEELEALVSERTAELMAAEASLHQAQKMEAVGQLTGGIAHDFNNMLQGVFSGIAMARRRIEQKHADGALRYLDVAHDAAERAAGLTRRLLAFARRQHLEPKPVNADGLVVGLADLLRRTVGPQVTVELRLRDSAGSVLCDPSELESALLNLCINARDAMPEGGRLAICTEDVHLLAEEIPNKEAPPGSYAEIAVTDTGTGMPPNVLARVFEPFFTTKPQGQGTGLGLSQVYGFVRQSGGLVRIESTPGRGTTVRLLLPLHESATAADLPPDEPSAPSAGARGTVLLVEDENAARVPAAERLRELGLSVLEARDGPEALRVLATARPDLLVTDVGLPNGMNGRQVAEAARERVPGLAVLFITGYVNTALPSDIEVIGKPFELDTLAHRVQAILAAQQSSDSDAVP